METWLKNKVLNIIPASQIIFITKYDIQYLFFPVSPICYARNQCRGLMSFFLNSNSYVIFCFDILYYSCASILTIVYQTFFCAFATNFKQCFLFFSILNTEYWFSTIILILHRRYLNRGFRSLDFGILFFIIIIFLISRIVLSRIFISKLWSLQLLMQTIIQRVFV